MAFSVEDFHDLIDLLEAHPEWRAELRRHVLSDELLQLPALVRDQAEHLNSLTARVDQIAVQLAALTARVDDIAAQLAALTARVDDIATQIAALTARMDQLAERMDQLAARMDQLTQRVDHLTGSVDQLQVDVAQLKDDSLENRYRTRAPAYFGRLVRRIRVLEQTALADLLDDAVAEGRLSEGERDAALLADLVLSGKRPDDQEAVYVVVEISAGVGRGDVERAADRAAVLAKLGRPAIPAVAGHSANPEAQALARERNVAVVLNGRTEG